MSRRAPLIREYMTHLPVEIEEFETVADAERAMQQQGVRHMPVMSGANLKGIVSQRDILQARAAKGKDVDNMPLDQLCQTDVLTVSPVDPLNAVATQMLERRVGSAIVMDGGFVVGIFTATDALRFLCQWFGDEPTPGE